MLCGAYLLHPAGYTGLLGWVIPPPPENITRTTWMPACGQPASEIRSADTGSSSKIYLDGESAASGPGLPGGGGGGLFLRAVSNVSGTWKLNRKDDLKTCVPGMRRTPPPP